LVDGLSGLFVVQVGYGRRELAEAAAHQAETLNYFPLWSYGHEPGIELAAQLASLAPGDLNRVFFTTGGSDAVESAWKLARQYFRAIGEPQRYKVIARRTAYHGTTLGALAITGVTAFRAPFEPLTPGGVHVTNTNRYRHPLGKDEAAFSEFCAEAIEEAILFEGPETVAAVFLEPVQNAGGCFTPPEGYFQRVREICDRYGVLLVSDEVICAYGRLGPLFGSERYGYLPDMITTAKGLTSGYSPLGAVLCRDFLAEPFMSEKASFTHGLTFGGHPVSCAVALRNLQIFDDEHIVEHVQEHEEGFQQRLTGLMDDVPIVGDVRGAGYFWAIELVKDQATQARFSRAEAEQLLRGFVAPALYEHGLIARCDDRGDPVIQLAPTLVAGDAELDLITDILRRVLQEAATR
ncbi:MAG: adenosylmethionine-8-amino-7-oxononanoate aminotransferase, partial [Actinomycetia bacterium]|nr:adenosylmethionine-8-amino-7-oxononanoate aminotransferase [Actinomycetes bacterium]